MCKPEPNSVQAVLTCQTVQVNPNARGPDGMCASCKYSSTIAIDSEALTHSAHQGATLAIQYVFEEQCSNRYDNGGPELASCFVASKCMHDPFPRHSTYRQDSGVQLWQLAFQRWCVVLQHSCDLSTAGSSFVWFIKWSCRGCLGSTGRRPALGNSLFGSLVMTSETPTSIAELPAMIIGCCATSPRFYLGCCCPC